MRSVGKRTASRPGRAPHAAPSGDIALVFGKNQDGVHILRRRDENAPIEAGLLQPLVEGRPITGELISMKRRDDVPFLYDVKSELPAPAETRTTPGPSQVATDSYRRGWDAIWGRRGTSSSSRSGSHDLN
jgi:hypothetical protein